jgi:hypothetical protein
VLLVEAVAAGPAGITQTSGLAIKMGLRQSTSSSRSSRTGTHRLAAMYPESSWERLTGVGCLSGRPADWLQRRGAVSRSSIRLPR